MATQVDKKKEFQQIPWVEKYRPMLLKDVIGNEDIVKTLENFRDHREFPNLLLCGPPGVGKTTSIHCLARELFGDKYNEAVMELNASDERGVDVIRTTIKNYCDRKVLLPDGMNKIIILDEADAMTATAFQALRRTMENYSNTTTFVLACNNPEKVIEPIHSRCVRLVFKPLSEKEMVDRIKYICKEESVQINDEGIRAIEIVADGDMRQAINSLQTCAITNDLITPDIVYQRNDLPSADNVQGIIKSCIKKDFKKAIEYLDKIQVLGFDAESVIDMIIRMLAKIDVAEDKRVKLYECASDFMIHRVNSNVQLYGLLAKFCLMN